MLPGALQPRAGGERWGLIPSVIECGKSNDGGRWLPCSECLAAVQAQSPEDCCRLATKGLRKGDVSETPVSLNSSPEMETWFVSRVMLKISMLLCVGRRCTDKRLSIWL